MPAKVGLNLVDLLDNVFHNKADHHLNTCFDEGLSVYHEMMYPYIVYS